MTFESISVDKFEVLVTDLPATINLRNDGIGRIFQNCFFEALKLHIIEFTNTKRHAINLLHKRFYTFLRVFCVKPHHLGDVRLKIKK